MRTFAVLPLLLIPAIAWGDCTEHLQTWAQALHPTLEFNTEHAACKVNPGDPSQVLAVLPMAINVDENGNGDYGIDVLVADSATGKVIAHRYQDAAFNSDTSLYWSLKLDTARYQIAPGLRAFGVRITDEGSSKPSPYESETLTLYVQDGSQLRPIMSDLVVRKTQGEWDMECAGTFKTTSRTLAVGNPGKDGFASLRVVEKTTDSKNVPKPGDECEEVTDAPKTKTFTLNYDGSQYGVPKDLAL